MGHSSLSGGSLNSSSSISAARFLQAFLCCDQFTTWQLRLQYHTILQAVHRFSFVSSDSALLQLAHAMMIVSMVGVVEDDMVKRQAMAMTSKNQTYLYELIFLYVVIKVQRLAGNSLRIILCEVRCRLEKS